jgi:hypothetical protein
MSASPSVADSVYLRPLPGRGLSIACLVAVLACALALLAWEAYWRGFGVTPSIQNSDGLWAQQRRRINQGEGDATVFIGSSRTLSNLQLDVWTRLEGREPIQLALEGTAPHRFLSDLAEDEAFTGRLLVGVAPGLFFSGYAYRGDALDHARKETPSQRIGQWLSMHALEPFIAFLDPDFALFAVLERQPWPQREGRRAFLDVRKLFNGDARRNNRLWSKLSEDAAYRELCRKIWSQREDPNAPPPTEAQMEQQRAGRDRQIDQAVEAVARLRARGVPVVFVTHPYAGHYATSEPRFAPRAEAWDILLERSGAPGIHFEDFPQLQGFDLPEWSHMTAESAEAYTAALYPLVTARFAAQSGAAPKEP